MVIKKGEKVYHVSDSGTIWKVSRVVGGVSVEYKIEKSIAPTFATLEKYINENNELF